MKVFKRACGILALLGTLALVTAPGMAEARPYLVCRNVPVRHHWERRCFTRYSRPYYRPYHRPHRYYRHHPHHY
jgi:hypothetical protein